MNSLRYLYAMKFETRDRMKKRKEAYTTPASILNGISDNNGWQKKLTQYSIFQHWRKIVDKDLAAHAGPLKIVQDVLWIEVENSAWMQQFQFAKLSLLQTLNEFLYETPLVDIRLVLKDDRPKAKTDDSAGVRFEAPQPEDIAAFEDQAATIGDAECRDALVRFWYLCHACKRD